MTGMDCILITLLLMALTGAAIIGIVTAAGFFRQIAAGAGDCWRADLF